MWIYNGCLLGSKTFKLVTTLFGNQRVNTLMVLSCIINWNKERKIHNLIFFCYLRQSVSVSWISSKFSIKLISSLLFIFWKFKNSNSTSLGESFLPLFSLILVQYLFIWNIVLSMMEKSGSSGSLPVLCLMFEAPEEVKYLLPRI